MDYKKYFKENSAQLSDRNLIAIKLGGLITAARLYSKLSQKKLAEEIGTKQPSIARAEKGEVVASIEFLYKIAKAVKTEFIFPTFGFIKEKEGTATSFLRMGKSVESSYFQYPDLIDISQKVSERGLRISGFSANKINIW